MWRKELKAGLSSLKKSFLAKADCKSLFKRHCALMDQVLTNIWGELKIDAGCCLIAVGGYGRGELYPHSDIDLLILLPDSQQEDSPLNQKIEVLIGLLWNLGLHVGHSVRTLAECMEETAKDITVQTNLLESRLLTGDLPLYQHYRLALQHTMDAKVFFAAKIKEQGQRHAKFNDSAHNLEPNIKESPGGLRDLHTILWLTQGLNLHSDSGNIWADLTRQHIITLQEARLIRQHERKLQQLRIHLHIISGRREDRLLFDFQNQLASILGYRNTPRRSASEQLMQDYYRSVKFICLFNDILLKLLQTRLTTEPVQIRSINADFESRNHLLEVKSHLLFQQRPSAILEAFLLLQQHTELEGMGAMLLRSMQWAKSLINRDFRQDPQNKKCFLQILSQPQHIHHVMRAMNRYDILGRYIPAFGKIIGQMQHDLFHVYTVDEHILHVLANLRRFSKPELKHEFPLCSRLFSAFDSPHLLYLAALFHDIAKGRGGDHSTLGTLDALRFCLHHGLAKEDAALVAWLVESHLKMSSTAQKSDLSDPSVIETFANYVQNERRLNALYLLTVADIRGTSPAVWNAWKARLLESLYDATLHAIQTPDFHAKCIIAARIQEASEKLDRFGLSPHSYQQLWQQFGDHYFSRYESDEIAWQSRLLTPHLNTAKPIVRARLSPHGDGIQVMIYSKDQNDLFARICNFFDRMGYSIVEAKIYTTQHHYALDSFLILDQSGKSVSYNGLLKFIESELSKKLGADSPLENPLQGRMNRQVKLMPIPTQVQLSEESDYHHKLDIIAGDRPGLLATLAQQLLKHDIALHNAKINTLGNRAEDSFLISARNNQKLQTSCIQSLYEALIAEI